MRKLFLFPGLYSLQKKALRLKWLTFPEIVSKLELARSVYKNKTGEDFDFKASLEKEDDDFFGPENIPYVISLIQILQLGMIDRLKNKGIEPDICLGFSVGSLSAAGATGCYSFENSVYHGIQLIRDQGDFSKLGSNYVIMQKQEFSEDQKNWLRSQGLGVTTMMPSMVNVSGNKQTIEDLKTLPETKGWRISLIMDYPMHSSLMKEGIEASANKHIIASRDAESIKVGSLYSYLHKKEINSKEDIREFLVTEIYKEIPWYETLTDILTQYKVSEIINIGPCESLLKIAKYHPLSLHLKVVNADELGENS